MEQDISGKFEGIGASLRSTKSGAVQIVRVFKGSPAEKAGVRADDIIEAVDGRLVTGMGTTEVAAIVRGPKGTDVRLTLRRADRPRSFDIVVTRDEIVIPLVTSKVVGKNSDIAYVSLFDFSATAGGQLEEEIQALLDRKPRALVLDLRDNPGGLLSQAAAVGDIFLKKGAFVIERDFKGAKKTTETTDRGIAQDVPLYVLVNGGSASAAEIVAGAIQDTGRGKLFGVTTFGKGSVQSPQTLSNGGQLRITIERWYTPNDRAIHGVGITPDLIVDDVPDDAASADEQLDAVVNFLDTGKLPTSIATPTATP
jgi:carboxyl-terminal processing protease